MEGATWDRPLCQGLDLNHAVLSLYIPFLDCVKLLVVGRVTSVSPVSEKGLWGTTVPQQAGPPYTDLCTQYTYLRNGGFAVPFASLWKRQILWKA